MAQLEVELHADEMNFSSSEEEESCVSVKSVVVKTDTSSFKCPVPACQGVGFRKRDEMVEHWRAKHLKYVLQHACPVEVCQVLRRRRTDLNRHFKKAHPQFGASAARILDTIPRVYEYIKNIQYVSPGEVKPPFPIATPRPPVGAVRLQEKRKVSLALAEQAKSMLKGVPVSAVTSVKTPAVASAGTPAISSGPSAALPSEAAGSAKDLSTEELEAAVAPYKQRIRELEQRLAGLVNQPSRFRVGKLEDLDISHPVIIVPDVSGMNKIFAVSRDDLRHLQLHLRTPLESQTKL